MGYTFTLFVHSYLRWLTLLLAVWLLARSWGGWMAKRPWTPVDQRVQVAFLAVVDTQLLLGLLLYVWLSPITKAFFASAKVAMKDPTLRFFGVEHLSTMLLALVAAHVGRAVGKRKQDPTARHRIVAITTLVFLALVLLAMPWPGRAYGRALFRSW